MIFSLTPHQNPNPPLTPSLLQVANRATLEFMLVTKRNSPERGRSHSFRVHTRGEFEKWLAALQQWLDSLPQQTL